MENVLKGLSWFAQLQIRMLKEQRTKAKDTADSDPCEVVRAILTKKLMKEIKRNTQIVYKSFRLTHTGALGSASFTIEDFQAMDFR